MAYYVYKDAASYWRWRLIAANNRIIADSAESYHNKADCLSAIGLVKGSGNAPVYDRLNCTEMPTFWHRQFFEPLLNGKRLFSCAGAAIFSLLEIKLSHYRQAKSLDENSVMGLRYGIRRVVHRDL